MLDGTEMAREREKITQPEHTAGHSQNKAIPEKSELVADQATTRWRQEVGGGERGKLGPRDSIPYQTANRLPVSNQRLPESLDGQHLPGGSRLEASSREQTQGECTELVHRN